MNKRLEEVVADVRELPPEEQDRVADTPPTFLSELQDGRGRWRDQATIFLVATTCACRLANAPPKV